MKINVFSYINAEKTFLKNENFRNNWLSIRDFNFQHLYTKMDEYCNNVLVLQFDDVLKFNVERNIWHPFYEKEYKKRQLVYFNSEMARQIIKFSCDIYKKKQDLNIHCWAGKSRSQAIAFCLNQYFNMFCENNEEDYIWNLENSIDDFMGNADVIKVLTKEIYCLNSGYQIID